MNRTDEEHLLSGLENMVDILKHLQEQIDLLTKIVTALDKRVTNLEKGRAQ